MPRGLWKGAISFGLVNVPVELFSAEKRSTELDLTLLDKRDLAPVGYKRYNKSTGKGTAGGSTFGAGGAATAGRALISR